MIDNNTDARFMMNNLLETGYNSLTTSSIYQGRFKADLTNERSRTFKFGGCFKITTANNKFYINSGTYTIPAPDTFTSGQDLANAMQTLLGVNYTVTYVEASGSFVFTHTSGFVVLNGTTTNAIWDTIGIPVSELTTHVSPYSTVEPRFHWPSEEIKIDFGYQAKVQFIGIVGDLSKELRIPEGGTVRFQANTIDDFNTPLVDKYLTWGKRGMFLFIDDVADTNFRYVKLTFESVEGPFISEIGYLYIGDYETFVDRNISVGVETEYFDTSIRSESDNGVEYVNQKLAYRNFTGLSVGLAKPVNVALLKHFFYRKQTIKSFFVALDPKLIISDSIDDYTMFCRFKTEPRTRHLLYKNHDLSFEVKETI